MKYFNYLTVLFSLCFALHSTAIKAADTSADNKADEDKIEVINLTVYPAPIPRPAMKYCLLPRYADQIPGNAALLYDTIFMQIAWEEGIKEGQSKDLKDEKEKEKFYTNADKLSLWLDTPLSEIPKDEVRKLLDNVQPWWMDYAEAASRRMDCDWETPIRELNNPYEINLYNMQHARSLTRILAMKARLSLAEGKPEEALKTLQIGFALAQHIGKAKEPMVSYLVALAITGVMRDELLDLIQLKDAPNLYWSLANLPHPFINIHNAIEWEKFAVERLFRELQEARTGQHSPEQWQQICEGLVERMNNEIPKIFNLTRIKNKEKFDAIDAKKTLEEYYPIARDYLINLGRSEKEIQSMAPARILLLYGAEVWEEMFDDYTKWQGIDYSQRPKNYGLSDLLKKYGKNPLLKFLAPIAVPQAQARVERNLDSLRCIEAIRLFAYSHNGKLPNNLDDITEVPIPLNPMTGKPFSYRLEGDTAVFIVDGHPVQHANYEYHIKIAK